MSAGIEAARRALAENPIWYQTIELAPGVVTPGQVDLRKAAAKILPESLEGLRALDVGSFDGFWAFEMERRGAEVVAIDLDRLDENEWPPLSRERLAAELRQLDLELGRGFRLASEALGSSARRVICNVYDLSPGAIGGPVDLAFSGAILLHLRDPVRALERIYGALRPGGELRLLEPISLPLFLLSPRRPAAHFEAARSDFNWWVANPATLLSWAHAAGFADARRIGFLRPPSVKAMRQTYVALSARRPPQPGGRSAAG